MENSPHRALERNDISLVELTIIVVRWKALFFSVFIVIFCAAGLYAFLSPAKQEFVGLYQLAKAGEGQYLNDPEAVVSRANSVWVPGLASENENKRQSLPDIVATNPEATGLIQLRTVARVGDENLVLTLHRQLLTRLDGWQSKLFQDYSSQIERRIDRMASLIDQIQGGKDTGEALAALLEKKIQLEHELDKAQKGEVLSEVSIGKGQASASMQIIILVGLLLAFILGLMSAFVAEFIKVVRNRMKCGR
ncbi:hypothetical protein KFJ24_09120 [Marinobacter sediminum]|uniref:hypothetical protein n=1 Tax=Marinobacter sediminum TaxID=256323 RepID=UPI00202FFBF9|nr:hypothetical protein [Marinobacter sediminum]MCM0612625.1 hypothetical protein [Marinobacter sediminum]